MVFSTNVEASASPVGVFGGLKMGQRLSFILQPR
jgi:hypothetical protein